MKASTILLAGLAQMASAHYFFDSVVSGNSAGPSFKYIRDFTRQTKYNPIKFSTNPTADIRDNSFIDGEDARCNQGAFTNAGKTQVLEVAAGSSVTVKLGVGAKMQHPGPSLFYMSKAPTGDVKAYRGDGDWFKIGESGVCNTGGDFTNNAWCSWDKDTLTTTVPKNTPSGEYLLRVEHIGVHRSHVNQPEHFVSCVQVKVTGGGNGTPGPMVKFPGAYKSTDPYANFSIYGGFKAFPMPGPKVWDGAAGTSPAPTTTKAAAVPTTTLVTSTKPAAVATPTAAAPACAVKFAQCGGLEFKGATCCQAGTTCTFGNRWYSQCL